MGCCKGKFKKAISIIEGNAKHIAFNFFNLPRERCPEAVLRLSVCKECKKITYLSGFEYYKWLKDNGIKIIKNFDKLETLPELPTGEIGENKKMFCKICKCYLKAKTFSYDEKCPLGKW